MLCLCKNCGASFDTDLKAKSHLNRCHPCRRAYRRTTYKPLTGEAREKALERSRIRDAGKKAKIEARRQEELRAVEHHQWRAIPSILGFDVSDQGRVRSYWRRVGMPPKLDWSLESHPVSLHKNTVSGAGYPSVRIMRKGYYIHYLVLEAFVGPRPEGCEACHNDGDPSHSYLSNLRWDTKKANHADRIRHGTNRPGEQATGAKLTWEKVRQIRERKYSIEDTAQRFGICQATVYQVLRGDTWKIVGGEDKCED